MNKQWDENINMQLSHRDIEIFKAALPAFIKRLERSSKIETHVFGTVTFQEAIEYCEHLQRCIDAALENMELAIDG